jgi:hypothetical protein
MKKLVTNILFGRDKLSGLMAFMIVAAIALGCTCGKNFDMANLGKDENSSSTSNTSSDTPFGDSDDDSAMPDDVLLNALVKETTASFAAAVTTEDFSNLYEKSSSDFKSTYTEAEMKNIFKDFTKNKRVITPILAKAIAMDPEFSPEPSIRQEQGLDILVTNGSYATKPVPTNFEYEYVKREGKWRLLKLIVKLQ